MSRISSLCRLPTVLLLCLAACSSSQPTGSVQFAASTQQALSASDVTRVKVTVSAADISPLVVELAKSNGTWGGLIGNIPAGSNRAFLAEAFDSSNTKRFQGQASGITITANQTTAVAITLQEIAPPPPYTNEAPVIDSIVASSTSVQTGASLSLTATVHDPNAGDTLSLAWTASNGSFSAPSAATTSWMAPSSVGVQTLTLTVTDSQGAAVSVSLVVNVVSGVSTGNAAINISFNLFPLVSKVSASLSRLDAGQSTSVSATASDADGDALSYQWTATCPGSWTNATSSSASFVPSSVPTSACNNCQLTVTVQDGRGGHTTGSLNLCVASSSSTRFAPLFTNFYQSATSTAPGQTVSFDVTAMDPQSSSLTFTWNATTGSLGTPANSASTSRITWTAPACVSAGMTPGITATVINAFNVTATKSFEVTGLPVCANSGWASTGSMAAPRRIHTATLLPNGKVLVAGGVGSGTLATAEVYDPASGSWSATGSMAEPRYYHTATLLPSGKVLVAGGFSVSGRIATAEVYDPASGSWSATGSMASPRSQHTATLLSDGRVLVAGGVSGGFTATAEVYDPASGSWSTTGSMAEARGNHTATLLPSGKVLISGGTSSSATLATAELYNPALGSWSAAASMASPRHFHAATLLPNGQVLVSGGTNQSSALTTAELYDPASGRWSATGSMAESHYQHPATLLNNGHVLVHGGSARLAEVYDPDLGTWSAAGSVASRAYQHTATLLPNGQVLVNGGTNGSNDLSTAELYTP
ncbi:Kelch repeat-containing protein [Hyalangium versicolor]|uniref:Kelch repeat-containing protein n=1 Tax=Hyalangium versicolor TaxID=2861190 RepID=UPI001CCD6C70|nr:kelch-like protein [Hyalangium versicolor]